MTDKEKIINMLLNDGWNFTLVYSMNDSELKRANSYTDYDDFTEFMLYMCRKYNI